MEPWIFKRKRIVTLDQFPPDCIGFIYKIEDEKGKSYIGRKSLISVTEPVISEKTYKKLKKQGVRVKKKRKGKNPYRKVSTRETNWSKYTGSSKELNDYIKKGGKIKRSILKLCFSKKQLTYYETMYQMCLGVIEENNEHYYNGNIAGKYFHKDLVCTQ